MNLSSSTVVGGSHGGRSTAELLVDLGERRGLRQRLEVEELRDIVEWADTHTLTTTTEDGGGAVAVAGGYLDTGVPVAGPGAPPVSEFGLMELVATLGLSPDGGRDYVSKVVECGWRLPEIYATVLAGRCPVWKALRVAELTRPLNTRAAGFVDRQLAFALAGATWAQVERLVAEAIVRFDPDAAEHRRQHAADARRFDVHLDAAGPEGTVPVQGVLDAADALDLDQAIGRRAKALGALGCAESLDVRRSIAAGEIARADLALDLDLVDEQTGEILRTVPGRKVELHLHLAHAALTTTTLDTALADQTGQHAATVKAAGAVGRLGNTNTPVTAGQVRAWVGQPGTTVTVRPVIDLADHVPVGSYEIPERLKPRIRHRDPHCAHPGCTRRAERCDLDHAHAYAEGGVTCPCNLVPLCRRHHRAKTFSGWRYLVLQPGTYLWISPHGRHWLVDHHGTHALDPPRSPHPAPDPPAWADPGWGTYTEPDWADPDDDPPPWLTDTEAASASGPPSHCPGARRTANRTDQPALFTHPPDQ